MQNRGSIATRSSIAKEENSGKTNFEHRTDVDIYKKVDFGDEKVDAEIRELQEQLKLSLKNRRKRDKIYKSYIDLGNAYYKLFKFDKAEACHLKHLALARETKYYNEEQVKTALTNLGAALRQQRRYDQALLAYKEALEIAEKINDLRGNARILNNMANVYEMQYDFDNAIECHKARSEVSSKLKDIDGQIKAFAALGSLYNLKGELRESIMYYEKVIINLRMKIVRRIVEGNKKKEQKGQAEEEAMTEPNSLDEIVYAAEDVVDAVEETTRGFFGLFKFKR